MMKIKMTAAIMLTLIVVTATIGVQEKRHFEVFFLLIASRSLQTGQDVAG